MFFLTRRRVRPLPGFLAAAIVCLDLALTGDAHPARALAATRVGLRTLAADRQAAAVAQTAVGADLHQPFQVLRALATQIALHLAPLDCLAQAHGLVLGQVLDAGVGVDLALGEDFARGRATDPEDVGEPDLDPLVDRDVDPRDACHRRAAKSGAACGAGSDRSPRARRCGG